LLHRLATGNGVGYHPNLAVLSHEHGMSRRNASTSRQDR
jgi:hypothetical protein